MKKNKKTVMAVISLVCLLSAPVAAKANSKPVNQETVHIVQQGECVSSIAEKYKGAHQKTSNFVVEIQVRNNIDEHIEPGQALIIPNSKEAE